MAARTRRIARRIGKAAAYTVTVVVLLATACLALLQTSWGKDAVRQRVEHRLSQRVNGTITVASVDYSFLFGNITLGGVTVSDAQGTSAIELGSLNIELNRRSLLRGVIGVNHATISRLHINVTKNADGTSNLTGLMRPGRRSAKPISLENLRLNDVSATIRQPDGRIIELKNLEANASVHANLGSKTLAATLTRVRGVVALRISDAQRRSVNVALDSLEASSTQGLLTAVAQGVVVGPLGVRSATIRSTRKDNEITGQQSITVQGVQINSNELNKLMGKPMLTSDIGVELHVDGPTHDLKVSGNVTTDGGHFVVTGSADLRDLTKPSYDVALVGNNINTSQLVPNIAHAGLDSVHLDVVGTGITRTDAEASVALVIGAARTDKVSVDTVAIRARVNHGTVHIEELAVTTPGLRFRARATMDANNQITALGTAALNPSALLPTLANVGIEIPKGALPEQLYTEVQVVANPNTRTLRLMMPRTRVAVPAGTAYVGGTATLRRNRHGDIVPSTADARVDLRGIDVNRLTRLLGRPPIKQRPTVGGTLRLSGNGERPRVHYDVTVVAHQPSITLKVNGTVTKRRLSTKYRALRSSDNAVLAKGSASLPLAHVGGKTTLARWRPWSVDLELVKRSTHELLALAPKRDTRGRIPAASLGGKIVVQGTAAKPTGTIHLEATGDIVAGATQRITVDANIVDQRGTPALTGNAHAWLDNGAQATAVASLGVNFSHAVPATVRGMRRFVRAGSLDVDITIPQTPVKRFGAFVERVARLPGHVSGTAHITGAIRSPAINSTLAWAGYRTASGHPAHTTINVKGSRSRATLTITHGANRNMVVTGDVRPQGNRFVIVVSATSNRAPTFDVIPAFVLPESTPRKAGTLDMNVSGTLVVTPGNKPAVEARELSGGIRIAGAALTVPGSGGNRTYRDISLNAGLQPTGLTIKSFKIHESDAQYKDRQLELTGNIRWKQWKPRSVDMELTTNQWLVFGPATIGLADAPRSTLNSRIGVHADLSPKIKHVTVTVHSLAFLSPKRHLRSHAVEFASPNNDIIYLKNGQIAGTLPTTTTTHGPTRPSASAKKRNLDVEINIPNPIRVQRMPFDIRTKGRLHLTMRGGQVDTRGQLKLVDGALNIMGHAHKVVSGTFTFSDKHPRGMLDFEFTSPLPPAVMRTVSKDSDLTGIHVNVSGQLSKPSVTFSGDGGGQLHEVMLSHNAGRGHYVSPPGLPASATVQAPRGEQPLVLTFLADNLPHMLFLDRFSAWADPYYSRKSYGRVENFEGETYSKRGTTRVRIVARPPTIGRSQAEVHYDRVFINRDNLAVGAGIRGGSRKGGGVGVFVEWSD